MHCPIVMASMTENKFLKVWNVLFFQLQNRQHFVDSPDMYSLQDLLDTNTNALLDELMRIHATFAKHIKFDCPVSKIRHLEVYDYFIPKSEKLWLFIGKMTNNCKHNAKLVSACST